MLAGGHCAELITEGHTCGHVEVDWGRMRVRRALEALPVDVKLERGAANCRGICPDYQGRILTRIMNSSGTDDGDEEGGRAEQDDSNMQRGGTEGGNAFTPCA